jgi:hypothetical protein
MRDHIGNKTQFAGIGPAYMSFRHLDIADIGKAFGTQQFLKDLRGDAGCGVSFEADRGDFRRRLCRERLAPGAKPTEAGGAGERGIR